MNFHRFSSALLFSLLCVSCQSFGPQNEHAQSAILFIGDGMGPAQMAAARLYRGGALAHMSYDQFEFTGMSRTYSSDNYTTDSAAAATALASGVKTYNGSIGMSDPAWESSGHSRQLETLCDLAKAAGKSVGIVTTTRITHATPASFFAHVSDRDSEAEIAAQVPSSDVDLFIGGGRKYFLPLDKNGKRKDGLNLLEKIERDGNRAVVRLSELQKISNLNHKVVALLADDHIAYAAEDKKAPKLSQMLSEAIRLLSQNPKGYFLMVEGGRIDHASHLGLAKNALVEMNELDSAIGEAMKITRNDQTLIVLTADHETGGLSLSGYGPYEVGAGENLLGNVLSRDLRAKPRKILSWASGPMNSLYHLDSAAHTAVDVVVAARGPGANHFTGWMNNTQIPLKIGESLDLKFTSKVNLTNQTHLKNLLESAP